MARPSRLAWNRTWWGPAFVALGVSSACGASQTKSEKHEAFPVSEQLQAEGPASPEPWASEGVRSARLASPNGDFELRVPDPKGWLVTSRAKASWMQLSHPASRSLLMGRLWRASRLTSDAECRASAHATSKALADIEERGVSVVEEIELPPRQGFRGVARVHLLEEGMLHRAATSLVMFKPGACLAVFYLTESDDGDLRPLVWRTLLVMEESLKTVRVVAIEDRLAPVLPGGAQGDSL